MTRRPTLVLAAAVLLAPGTLAPMATAQNARLVKDIVAGSGSSTPRLLTPSGARFYFVANPAGNLFVSAGTPGGTRQLGTVGGIVLLMAGPTRVYAFSGKELWTSTGSGAVKLRTFSRRFLTSDKFRMAMLGDRLMFQGDDGFKGAELWTSDGSAAGTTLVKDIHPSSGSGPGSMHSDGRRVWFSAHEPVHGNELWVSDGTSGGTRLVKDIRPGTGSGFPQQIAQFGDRIVFSADDGVHSREPWTSDGTAAGTQLLADIAPGRTSLLPTSFTPMGDKLYFVTGKGALWSSDGTAANTQLVKQIPNFRFSLNNLTAAGDRLYFWHFFGSTSFHLWTSDGTAAGTTLVHVWRSGGPFAPLGAGRVTYPGTDHGIAGAEVFVSDGTRATSIPLEIQVGAASSGARETLVLGNTIYTSATDGTTGQELWAFDGIARSRDLDAGCRGARLAASPPVLQRPMRLELHGMPANQLGFLAVGVPANGTPIGGCRLYVNLAVSILLPITPTGTTWSSTVPVPNDPAAIGVPVALQGAHGPGLVLSNASIVQMGR